VIFANLEHLRVSLAKHQISGKAKSIAYAPGYGRIDMWCRSFDYELGNGGAIWGTLNRQEIADSLRSILDRSNVPTDEDIASFDNAMKDLSKLADTPFPGDQ
jgi:hypothetical protein